MKKRIIESSSPAQEESFTRRVSCVRKSFTTGPPRAGVKHIFLQGQDILTQNMLPENSD